MPQGEESGQELRQCRIDSEDVPVPNFAGVGTVIGRTARSYQTDFINYYNYGLQQHLAHACVNLSAITPRASQK